MKSTNILKTLFSIAVSTLASAMIAGAIGLPVATVALVLMPLSVLLGMSNQGAYAFEFISGTPITFNGKEAREGIIEPAYMSPEISEFLTIVEDIVAKEQIAFLGRITKITQIDAGCGTGAMNKAVPMTDKFWNPVAVKAWLTQCASDLESTFFVWGLSKGIKKYDLTTGDFIDFAMDIMTTAVKEDALRLIWFGDTGADTILNASFLQDAGDIPFYDAIDGLWKQVFDAVTATTMNQVAITANAGGTYALQALGATDAYDIFRGMLEQADARLKSEPNKMILCTTSMWENWLTYKETRNIDMSFVRQEKGFKTDMYRGVPIYAMDFWDRQINSDMNDGTAWITPHRALLTTKENMLVGLDASGAIQDFKVFLDDVTEINHMKGGYKVDVKIIHEFMTIAAY